MLKILTEASYKVGFGHLARMSCIADRANESGVGVSVILDTNGLGNKLFQKDYILEADWVHTGNEAEYLSSTDILVLDSYHVDQDRINAIKKKVKNLIVVDDNIRIDYKDLIVINPNYFGEYIQYPQDKGNDYRVGKDYTLLRKPFAPPQNRTAAHNVSRILVSFGGTDVGSMTETAIRAVKAVRKEIIVDVVVTNAYKALHEIQSLLSPWDNIIQNASAEEMAERMREVDFAITSAGGTSNELIKCQCPALIIPVADNQQWNAKVLQVHQLAATAEDLNAQTILPMFQQDFRNLLIGNMKEKSSASTGADFVISLCG